MIGRSARVLLVDDSRTIRGVARRTLERAGYEVAEAGDIREALERAQAWVPHVVLLDWVLPGGDGAELCRRLAEVHNLADIPRVVMSARLDRIGEAQLAEAGVTDAIKKPFGPEALLAVTTHAVGRRATRSEAGGPEREEGGGDDRADADEARLEAARKISEHLAAVVGPALEEAGLSAASRGRVAAAIRDHTSFDTLFALADELAEVGPGASGELSFSGRISHVSLGEILQLLQHQRQTGVLSVEHRERRIAICLREGLVDIALAQGTDPEFRLGRYLLEEGLIERADLHMLLDRRAGSRRLLGAQLVKLGYVTAEDVSRVLVRQTSELTYEALRWPDGRYRFERFALRPEAEQARLGLPMSAILMEGLRRVDEWRLIEEQIRGFDMVLAPDPTALEAVDPARFEGDERRVLAALDGSRTVREVISHTQMSSFDCCKVLFQLLTSRLVREVS